MVYRYKYLLQTDTMGRMPQTGIRTEFDRKRPVLIFDDDQSDSVAELLSQLSSVRSRSAAAQSVSSQLQQLENQIFSASRLVMQFVYPVLYYLYPVTSV